jgi:hypothetical protein
MKRLSKWFYLGSMIGFPIGGTILLTVAVVILVVSGMLTGYVVDLSHADSGTLAASILLILLSGAAILYGLSIWYILLYKAWSVIQDSNANTTPGKAVGFIFIPVYNFYWIFKAWWGFARDYNRYIERHNINTSKLKEGLFLAFCILSIFSMVISLPIPCLQNTYLIYMVELPFLAIFIITANQTIDAINSLLDLQTETTISK